MVSLKAEACTKITVGVKNVGTGIHEKFFGDVGGTNDRVFAGNLAVELDIAGDMTAHYSLGVGTKGGC